MALQNITLDAYRFQRRSRSTLFDPLDPIWDPVDWAAFLLASCNFHNSSEEWSIGLKLYPPARGPNSPIRYYNDSAFSMSGYAGWSPNSANSMNGGWAVDSILTWDDIVAEAASMGLPLAGGASGQLPFLLRALGQPQLADYQVNIAPDTTGTGSTMASIMVHLTITAQLEIPDWYQAYFDAVSGFYAGTPVFLPGDKYDLFLTVSPYVPANPSDLPTVFFKTISGRFVTTVYDPNANNNAQAGFYYPDFMEVYGSDTPAADTAGTTMVPNFYSALNDPVSRETSVELAVSGDHLQISLSFGEAIDTVISAAVETDPIQFVGLCVNGITSSNRTLLLSDDALAPSGQHYDYAVLLQLPADTHSIDTFVWLDLPVSTSISEVIVVALTEHGSFFRATNTTRTVPAGVLTPTHGEGFAPRVLRGPSLPCLDLEHYRLIVVCAGDVIDDYTNPYNTLENLSYPINNFGPGLGKQFWQRVGQAPGADIVGQNQLPQNTAVRIHTRIYEDIFQDLPGVVSGGAPMALPSRETYLIAHPVFYIAEFPLHHEIRALRWGNRDNDGRVTTVGGGGSSFLVVDEDVHRTVDFKLGFNALWHPSASSALVFYEKVPTAGRYRFDGRDAGNLRFYNSAVQGPILAQSSVIAPLDQRSRCPFFSVLSGHLWGHGAVIVTDGVSGAWQSFDLGQTWETLAAWTPAFPETFVPRGVEFIAEHPLCWGALALDVPEFETGVAVDDSVWPDPPMVCFRRTWNGGQTWDDVVEVGTLERVLPAQENADCLWAVTLFSMVVHGHSARLLIAHGCKIRWFSDNSGQTWDEILYEGA